MKKHLFSLLCGLILLTFFPENSGRARPFDPPAAGGLLVAADPYALIVEVNALRAANGLAAYAVSPVLMTIAQQQAEFMAANGVSHSGYGGTRPYQRALNAGYPLSGDLSLGGFFSENITAGNNKSVQQAVEEWQGDAPHLTTMLSPNLTEIGAGVAFVGDYVYYVIDCAQPTGSTSVLPAIAPTAVGGTPGSGQATATPDVVHTLVPVTPDAQGKIYHEVQPGETLWLIAVSYGVKVADIRKLNNLAENQDIYPKMKLLIMELPTPTITVTATLTTQPSFTPFILPSLTPLPTLTPTPARAAAVNSLGGSLTILGAIIFVALILAAVFAKSSRR